MSYTPICSICKEPVTLEESKSDEHGRAVHENCYVWTIELRKPPRGIELHPGDPNLPTIRATGTQLNFNPKLT